MMTGMYAAISGLDANQALLNETANNLANVNTVGFKASSVTFSESLTQVMRGASGPTATNGGSNPVQIGLGVQVAATRNEMTEGSFQTTNNPLDIAIEGNGFLRVGAGTPPAKEPYTTGLPAKVNYTRAGDLTTNSQGFLTTEAGEYVIGRNAVATETEAGTTYAAGKEESYITYSAGLEQRVDRPGRIGRLHRREPRIQNLPATGHRGLHIACDVPQRSWPGTPRRLAVGRDRQLGHADRRHPRHPGLRLDDRRGARDVKRRSCHRDDQHDHRRAWLPGQLARDLDSQRNARDAGHDGAVAGLSERDQGGRCREDNSEEHGMGRRTARCSIPSLICKALHAEWQRCSSKDLHATSPVPTTSTCLGTKAFVLTQKFLAFRARGVAMITLNRLGHSDEPFQLNPDMVVTVESTPDTVITLATGAKVVVAETPEEVAAALHAYRAGVLSEALRNRRPPRQPGRDGSPPACAVEDVRAGCSAGASDDPAR